MAFTFKTTAAYEEALEALSDREAEAAAVLRAFDMSRTLENAMRVGACRFRRRTFRRALAKASSEDVENVGRLNAQLAEQVGGTRPVDPPPSLGVSALVRRRGFALTALSLPLVVPSRGGLFVAGMALAELALLLVLELRTFRYDPELATREGIAARASRCPARSYSSAMPFTRRRPAAQLVRLPPHGIWIGPAALGIALLWLASLSERHRPTLDRIRLRLVSHFGDRP